MAIICVTITYDDKELFLFQIYLIYADRNLADFYSSCTRTGIYSWNLTVNIPKTKIVVFRKGGILSHHDHWFYSGQEIEIVNSFTYLGVVFSSGGSFMLNTKTLS